MSLPDALLLVVYGKLGYKDRLALSHTCGRLKRVAENGGAFSDHPHTVKSPESLLVALANRPREIYVADGAAFNLLRQGYTMLVPAPRWPITQLHFEKDADCLLEEGVKLSLIFPALESLELCFSELSIVDSPSVFAGLTRLTHLSISLPDGWLGRSGGGRRPLKKQLSM